MKLFQLLCSSFLTVNAQGESTALYYKDVISQDLDNFILLWEDKKFGGRSYPKNHHFHGKIRKDNRMRNRVSELKKRMDRFYNPTSCQKPWKNQPAKIMEQWFSIMDNHPCRVAQNIAEGINTWLHNFGCTDAIIENVEIFFDTENMTSRRKNRIIGRRVQSIIDNNYLISRAPCKRRWYEPETTTSGATTSTEYQTTTQTTTTTTSWQSTSQWWTTIWSSSTASTPW
ncbi:Oidioi.mRNA.OKI2018_I69.chr2.g4995.t1.cds [Oikopleura dioica]|uniref:Oidioi.mRNA.OKI2018_I69.chr2.g4995.t1.cds n=1 Tax=Oikopleura dioica TaxID=34765 RepID=A0ABN7SYM7_OIKDI|nr:Oidioi.mRNA.OKI2018_I69.chr2.g4995.t1.cds [Oikopleura dioica]